MAESLTPYCPYYHRAVAIITRRWTPEIVRALMSGTKRFGAIKSIIPGLSDRLLSERLKDLEAEGLVTRSVTPETPVLIEYCLTEKGMALCSVVKELATWAETWLTPEPAEADM
ncbi:MAG TPA: helix-turn-helix domain-containing protein [Actinomycetota bacterium]|jgi:DNA-binding HxlR family transcriptional regulator|nr:helix-turn-helix domain-containing protein [Actinomycetota bacterium]